MKLSYTVCAVSWKSADLTHIPADLWPLKRYGTCAPFCVYLFEVTHKKDRLSPLSSTNNLLVEFGNHTPTRLAPLSTRPKTVRVEVTRLELNPLLDSNDGMSFLARCHKDSSLQHPFQDQHLYRLYTIDKHPAATLLSPTIPLPIHAAAVPL